MGESRAPYPEMLVQVALRHNKVLSTNGIARAAWQLWAMCLSGLCGTLVWPRSKAAVPDGLPQ